MMAVLVQGRKGNVRTDSGNVGRNSEIPTVFLHLKTMLASRASTVRNVRRIVRSFATLVDITGVKVVTLDYNQPTSSVTVLVKAGSRFEPKQGVANVLKNFAFKVCPDSGIEVHLNSHGKNHRVLPKDRSLEPFVKANFMVVFCRRVLDVNIWP